MFGLVDDITVWIPSTNIDVYGSPMSYTRKIIKGRWEDNPSIEITINGEVYKPTVYCRTSERLPIDTWIYNGISLIDNPMQVTNNAKVVQSPIKRGLSTEDAYKVYC